MGLPCSIEDKIAEKIIKWARMDLNVLSGLQDSEYMTFSIDLLNREIFKPEVLQFIKSADLNKIILNTIPVVESHLKMSNMMRDGVKK